MRFPVDIHAETERPGEPDFVLSWPDRKTLGVEVTEAGEEDYQAWMTNIERKARKAGGPKAHHMPDQFEGSIEATANQIETEIRKKVAKYDKGYYQAPAACDLVVYDNTAWGGFLDKRDLLDAIGRPNSLLGRFRQVDLVAGQTVYLDLFGSEVTCVDLSRTYEIDYARWILEQVEQLRKGATGELDLIHIAEELEDLGRSDRRALASHLRNLMLHLLKWQLQPEMRSDSWLASINDARSEIYELLMENPSLRGELEPQIARQYERARMSAATETGLPLTRFPKACPYGREQLIDPEYFPEENS